MDFQPITLPYAKESLAPFISASTMEYHYEKHYKTYLANCNKLKEGTDYGGKELEHIVKSSTGALYNNAAQVFNHEFFFKSLSPMPQKEITGVFLDKINSCFGSFDNLKAQMSTTASTLFGSGWVWLVVTASGDMKIVSGSNAYCPLVDDLYPLLCVDVWEHAYYLDYQNRRADFLKHIWNIIDWQAVQERCPSKKCGCR